HVEHPAGTVSRRDDVVDLETRRQLVGHRTRERRNRVVDNAWKLGLGMKRQHRRCYAAPAGLRDLVAGEGVADGAAASVQARGCRVIECPRQLAKVTLLHARGRQGVQTGELSAALVKLVPGKKPKRLVAAVVKLREPDGSAEGSSPLILLCRCFLRIEKSTGVEDLVAQEVEAGAMEPGGAALHGETRDGAQGVRIFGRVIVGDEL